MRIDGGLVGPGTEAAEGGATLHGGDIGVGHDLIADLLELELRHDVEVGVALIRNEKEGRLFGVAPGGRDTDPVFGVEDMAKTAREQRRRSRKFGMGSWEFDLHK